MWDIFVSCVLYSASLYVTFRTFFRLVPTKHYFMYRFSVDIIYIIDIVVEFHTGYGEDFTNNFIFSRDKIASRYLRSWFFLDLIASLPFEFIAYTVSNSTGLQRTFSIISLLKLRKFYRLSELFSLFHISRNLYEMPRIAMQLLFICHVFACIWNYIATTDTFDPVIIGTSKPDDVIIYHPNSWVTDFGFLHAPYVSRYVAALYWAIMTMVTVGYGDIHAVTTKERVLSIIVELCGVVIYGALIAAIVKFLNAIDVKKKETKDCLAEIVAYLAERSIPPELRRQTKVKSAHCYYYFSNPIGSSPFFLHVDIRFSCVYTLLHAPLPSTSNSSLSHSLPTLPATRFCFNRIENFIFPANEFPF